MNTVQLRKSVIRLRNTPPAPRQEMKYFVSIYDPYTIHRVEEVMERYEWLRDNVGNRAYILEKRQDSRHGIFHVFGFAEAKHAMLFKLTWGGK